VLATAINFYFSLCSEKIEISVSGFLVRFLSLLIPLSVVLALIITFLAYDNVIGIGHIYYSIRGIEIVKETGSILSLKFIKTFDNFLSSPGFPIFGSIFSMITLLESTQLLIFGEIWIYALILVLVFVMINSFKSHKIKRSSISLYILIFITVVSLLSILPPFLNYNFLVLPLLLLMIYLLTAISLSLGNTVGNAISFLLALSASLLYYLPGTLMVIFIIGSLFYGNFLKERKAYKEDNILAKTTVFKWIAGSSVLLITLYIIYQGYFFYEDFSLFFRVMLRNLKVEPFIVVTGLREKFLSDSMRFALYLSRIGFIGLGIIMVASMFHILACHSSARWLSLSTLLFSVFKLGSQFVHAFTDYISRFNIYLALVAPVSLFAFFNKTSLVSILYILERLFRKEFLSKKQLIYIQTFLFSLCLIGFTFSILYSQLLIPLTPKMVSDERYFMYDSWIISHFVGKNLKGYAGINILGFHRYMYIQSLYDLNLYELSSNTIENLETLYSKRSWILILSSLSLKLPDRYTGIVSQETINKLSNNTAIIYNSYYSFVFFNIV
jgi:hypothetical protein